MKFYERPIIITDFETTGLDPRQHDIIEIGAIKVDHTLNEIARLDEKVKIQHHESVEPEALAINGYNEQDWKNAITIDTAMTLFTRFAKDGILGAWNITFEYGFLQQALKRTGIADTMDYHRIDIPSIVWYVAGDKLESLSMDAVAKRFGMEPEPKPHRGITGADYELQILRKLRGQ